YDYDGFGNRKTVKETVAGKIVKNVSLAFNAGNQLETYGNEKLKYDANGNRTADGKYNYTWNEADQLTTITKQGETTPFAKYKYDDDGRRIEKEVNGQITRYFYDGDSINPLYETNGSGEVLRQYVYSIDGVRLAMKAQGQTLFYHYNPRGDVVAMTDGNGQVVANYEYDAWGNVLKSDAKGIAADNPFGYAGYMYDKEIGMYYLIARYYNPEHGVFLSVDPDPGDEDDPVTQNGYTYADNNPVMNIDPDGHYAVRIKTKWSQAWRNVDRKLTQWSRNDYVGKHVAIKTAKGARNGAVFGGLAGAGYTTFNRFFKVGRGVGGLGPKKFTPTHVGIIGGAVIGGHVGASKGAITGYAQHWIGKGYVKAKPKVSKWWNSRKKRR
ncbi:wall-associated protein, partial [Bacillus toyonensis]